jgi:cytohesin
MLTFFNPIREGWLWKQGGRYKTWKRRWFILNDGCLYYFELTDVILNVLNDKFEKYFLQNVIYLKDKEPRGIIPLENVNVREVDDKTKQFCFEIYSTTNDKIKACKHDSEGKVVEG